MPVERANAPKPSGSGAADLAGFIPNLMAGFLVIAAQVFCTSSCALSRQADHVRRRERRPRNGYQIEHLMAKEEHSQASLASGPQLRALYLWGSSTSTRIPGSATSTN